MDLGLALTLLVMAAALLGGAFLAVRAYAARPTLPIVPPPVTLPKDPARSEAPGVVLAEASHVVSINQRAREFFGLNGQTPNLESLGRQVTPTDQFLALFGGEGQAQLHIGHRRVEATSLRVPPQAGKPAQTVVMLKEIAQRPEFSGAASAETVTQFTDLSRDITASLDMGAVVEAILRHTARLLQSDLVEITHWDEASQLIQPAGAVGDVEYRADPANPIRLHQTLLTDLVTHRRPLRVDVMADYLRAQREPPDSDFPFQSYLGVPLMLDAHLLGTVEVMCYKPNVYQDADVFLLTTLAGPAAAALHNARRFAEQQRRVAELTGLAEITRAMEMTADPTELYGRLAADIGRFMDVQMVGFLLPDAESRALVGQPHFFGVPDIVVEMYRIPLTANSRAAQLWRSGDYWLTNDVSHDPLVDESGLRELAETAGVKRTVLAPILAGGRRLGVVQISNKNNNAPFAEDDVRLLLIFAGQAAAILDNARLVRETQARAEQAEGLRQIAVTIASSNNLDDILRSAMRQAAALLHFDFGMIALLDEARGELVPHPAAVFGGQPEEAEVVRLRTDDPNFNYSVTRTRRAFRTGRAQQDRRITGFYRPLIEHYPINSVMDIPLVVGDRSLGEMIVGARAERAFTRAHQQLLTTIAAQLAAAIERTRLYAATDQNLQRRVEQLTALTRVGRELNQTMQLDHLLRVVYNEAAHAAQADASAIILLDLAAGPGKIAQRLSAEGEAGDPTLSPLELEALSTERPKQVLLPAPDPATGARVELAVPILAEGVAVGLIYLRRQRPEPFEDSSVETLAALAAQTGVAVSNVQRYHEQVNRNDLLRRRADQLTQLFEISRAIRSDRSLISNLETIAYGLQEAVGFNVVLISVLDSNTRRLRRTAAAGVPLQVFEQAKRVEQPWEAVAQLLHNEFRVSQSYFLPEERAAELTRGLDLLALPPSGPAPAGERTAHLWHPNDLLLIPLRSPQSDKEPVGLLTLDAPRSGLRPDRNTVEVIEIFANQAALAIENTQLYQATERRAARLLALHRVIERVSREADHAQVWQAAAEAIWSEMGRDVCVIALVDGDHLTARGKAGRIRGEIDFPALLSAAPGNPLSHTVAQRQPLLVLSVKDSDWAANPTVIALGVKSFIAVPLLSHGAPVGAVFIGSLFLPSPFMREDVDLFLILASQLSAAHNRAQLEADLQRRATQLSALAEVSRTITAALKMEDVVGGVLDNLRVVIPYDSATLWLREGQTLRIAAARGFENDAERLGLSVDIADSVLFAEMAQSRNIIHVPDVRQDPVRFPAGELQPTRTWLGAPLVSKDQIIGALALDRSEPHAYGHIATQVLLAYANQAAIALENARLFEEGTQRTQEADQRLQRLALLNRFSAQLSGTLKLDRIFEILLAEVQNALHVERAAVVTFEAGREAAVAVQLVPIAYTGTLNPHNPALARVGETLAPLAVEDVMQDIVMKPARTDFLNRQVRSLLVVPLAVAGQLVAALQLEEVVTRRFTPEEIELAQTLANQAAVAVQNARLYDETQARLVELATFNQISQAITSTIDLGQIYQTVAEQVGAVMGVTNVYLALYDEDRRMLTFPIFVERGQRLPAEPRPPSGLTAHIIQTRQPLLLRGADITPQLQELDAGRIGPDNAKSYLGVPLISGDRVRGVLAVQDLDRANALDFGHENLLTTIAAQVSVAVENARLYEEVQSRAIELSQRNERLSALNRLSNTLSAAALDLEVILRQAAEQVTLLFRVDHSGVVLFDGTGLAGDVHAEYPAAGLVGQHLDLADSAAQAEMLTTRRPVAVEDVARDPRLSTTLRASLQRLGIRSILFVPFISQGEAIGSFSLDAVTAPRRFTDDEVELCQIIAAQIAVAVENARFTRELEARVTSRTQEVERERERVETLLQITTELASNLELDRVLVRALQLVTEAVNAPRGSVFLIDFLTDQLIHRAALGRTKALSPNGEPAPFRPNEGLVGWVMKNRQPVVIGDLDSDLRWKRLPEHGAAYKSALAVPLMANGEALGAMLLLSPEREAFDEDQLRLASAAADRVGDAINNAELYRLIREQAERLGSLLREKQVEATKSRAILEGIADGVLVADTSGEVILFNAASERILSLPRENVVGRPLTEFAGIYGAAGKAWIEATLRWTANPYSYQPGEFFDQRIELEDNRVLSVHLAPVIANDEYLGSVSLLRDITRDVEVDRLKSEFVTNVSHELRTPMTSIKGYADLLLMGATGQLSETQAQFVSVIKNNADRLSILVNDLLDISRIESGRVQLALRAVEMGEVIRSVADNVRGRIDEEHKPMTIVTDIPPDLPSVWADRERVVQIVTNLADNAFNYSHAEGTITLKARSHAERAEVVVEVTDTGVGIALEDQPRLFDRFYRGEDALVLAAAGTGLGLPIARQLAEMHGGRLWLAHSEAGRGSTFALALPMASRVNAE